MSELWDQAQAFLAQNQLFQGGLVLGLLTWAWAYCRGLPYKVTAFIRARLFVEYEIPQNDPAFKWVDGWLSQHGSIKYWSRWFMVTTVNLNHGPVSCDDEVKDEVILAPAPGTHWVWWNGLPIWVYRSRRELQMANDYKANFETYNITMWAWGKQRIQDLLAEVKVHADSKLKFSTRLYVPNYQQWNNDSDMVARPLESVILARGIMERLVSRIDRFLKSRDKYAEKGIPWRMGVLLHGKPGNGKSSIVSALASHFKLNLCVLTLTKGMTDDQLFHLITRLPKRAAVLLEDIDCVVEGRARAGGVTFAGLLNAIDGVISGEGRILFMTTNRVLELDPALIRPGRCDIHEEILDATEEQAARMFLKFFPNSTRAAEFGKLGVGYGMSVLQGHLQDNEDDEEKAVRGPICTPKIGGAHRWSNRGDQLNPQESCNPDKGDSRNGEDSPCSGDGDVPPPASEGRALSIDEASRRVWRDAWLPTGRLGSQDVPVLTSVAGRVDVLREPSADQKLDRLRGDRNRPSPIHERADTQ